MTTGGLNVNGLPAGQRLRIGEARLEVAIVCTPCSQVERIRPGLRKEVWGRGGMLCWVLEGGVIRAGDPIEKLPRPLSPSRQSCDETRGEVSGRAT